MRGCAPLNAQPGTRCQRYCVGTEGYLDASSLYPIYRKKREFIPNSLHCGGCYTGVCMAVRRADVGRSGLVDEAIMALPGRWVSRTHSGWFIARAGADVRNPLLRICILLFAATSAAVAGDAAAPPSGQSDFDFEIGTWRTQLKRLLHPLTGSTQWVEYDGTTIVRKGWNGRANLVELDVTGPSGHIEALSLRLYNPASRQWSLNFSNSAGGTLAQPMIGEFRNGRGEFYDQETLDGRAIFVRFVISCSNVDTCHFEQAFSPDGGKTWEVNWIATDTRVK